MKLHCVLCSKEINDRIAFWKMSAIVDLFAKEGWDLRSCDTGLSIRERIEEADDFIKSLLLSGRKSAFFFVNPSAVYTTLGESLIL